MDMLLNKRDDVLYVVDELERSLHPKLTERFLQLFMQLHDEQRMQLLFTTHESSIMDPVSYTHLLLSGMLKREGIPHTVLNAKFHEKEAEIVALAGCPSATNSSGKPPKRK